MRVFVRRAGAAQQLEGAEVAQGDLRDARSVQSAVSGCGAVYHVAADYRLWARDTEELYRSNVEGTRNLLEACRRSGTQRVVYTSTVGCIGIPKNGVGDESTAVSIGQMGGHYKRSKFLAEQVALESARGGAPVVVVNPTAPVGDHDRKPTPTGKVILDFLQGRMPAYVDTGLNLVDARDVAAGHILACERGTPGERYILGGENLTLAQIFRRLETISGVTAPRIRLPYFAAYAFGALSTAVSRLTGKMPRAPLEGVRMARVKMFVSCRKAQTELGYQPRPVDEALERAVHWFRANGYC